MKMTMEMPKQTSEDELRRSKSREKARKQLAEAQESGDEAAIDAAQREMDAQHGNYTSSDSAEPKLSRDMADAELEARDKRLIGKEKTETEAKAEVAHEEAAKAELIGGMDNITSGLKDDLKARKAEKAEAEATQAKKADSALDALRNIFSKK